jgi:hypothetical protein
LYGRGKLASGKSVPLNCSVLKIGDALYAGGEVSNPSGSAEIYVY